MSLQYYTFLNGERKIAVCAEDDSAAWNMAFEMAPTAETLTKLPEHDPEQFKPEVIYAGETIH